MGEGIRIMPGDFVKARFWRGEAIWAKVTAVTDGSVDALLANEPAPSHLRPDGYKNPLKEGSAVSCGVDEILDHIRTAP